MANNPRSLRLSLFDAFFFSIMVGAGESYLPAFALSAGIGETWSGLFATVPLLIGAIVQLISPGLVHRFGNPHRFVVIMVMVQAMAFLPLMYFSIYGTPGAVELFLVAAVYWGAGFAAGPTWNFWMGQLVSAEESPAYFYRRGKISQYGILVGLVGGGYALYYNIQVGWFTSVFAFLFFISFLARASSSLILAAKDYNPNWILSPEQLSLKETVRRFARNEKYRSFFGFLFIFTVSVYFSAPFVVPYLLARLKFSYQDYMLTIAALFLAKILVLPYADRWARKIGVKNLFLIGAIGISPLPAFWFVSDQLWYAIVLQMVSGAFWALYEVSLTILFFSQLGAREKIPVLTVFNFFNALALIIGSACGGKMLHYFAETKDAYFLVFAFGSGLRLLVAGVCAYLWRGREKVL